MHLSKIPIAILAILALLFLSGCTKPAFSENEGGACRSHGGQFYKIGAREGWPACEETCSAYADAENSKPTSNRYTDYAFRYLPTSDTQGDCYCTTC